uniref:Uncharacterized protein n=1 Tax=Neogobius melanostomus TaxID=47308 RepID=A0A8C6V6B1_9GOBI
ALFLSLVSYAADCTHYATRGKRYDIPLEKDSKEKRLIWTKVATRVYDSKKQVNEYSVTEEGSLILPKVTKADDGDYTWALTDTDGRQVGKKELKLCVLVQFTCTGTQVRTSSFITTLTDANAQLLVRTSTQVGSNSFFCNVSNPVSSESSDKVQPDCFKTKEDKDNLLFGLDFWLMVGILTGGGGLVLVLIVATIVCCYINKRKRRLRIKGTSIIR